MFKLTLKKKAHKVELFAVNITEYKTLSKGMKCRQYLPKSDLVQLWMLITLFLQRGYNSGSNSQTVKSDFEFEKGGECMKKNQVLFHKVN